MLLSTVYQTYSIPKNLQYHQVSVAIVANEIINHWNGPKIAGNNIILTCFFHDIAKIINFDLNKIGLFTDDEQDLCHWKEIRDNFINLYGIDEKKATLSICEELNLSKTILNLINNLEWELIEEIIINGDFDSAICVYSDLRVSPKGIISIQDRILERSERVNVPVDTVLWDNAIKLEMHLQNFTTINIRDIGNSIVTQTYERFLSYTLPA